MGNSLVFQWLRFWASSTEGQRRRWHLTPELLPGKSHGRKSPVGYSPWSRTESDTTEQFHFHFSLSCIGEGNVNALQCCCLENPRDGGAWWAAIYAVAQSQTRMKWLSSKSKGTGVSNNEEGQLLRVCHIITALIKAGLLYYMVFCLMLYYAFSILKYV